MPHLRSRSTRVLVLAMLLTSASAPLTGIQEAAARCLEGASAEAGTPTDRPPMERAVPSSVRSSSEPSADATWPIASVTTGSVVDALTGETHTMTTTVRVAPDGEAPARPARVVPVRVSGASGGGRLASVAAAVSCVYSTTASATTAVYYGGGAFTQTFQVFWHRYTVTGQGSGQLWGYLVYTTNVWWSRSSTVYNLSAHNTSWYMEAYACPNGVWDPRSAGGGGWTPLWETPYQTYTYAYQYPMDSWPIEFSDLFDPYQSRTTMWTDVTQNGQYVGRISGSYEYPQT